MSAFIVSDETINSIVTHIKDDDKYGSYKRVAEKYRINIENPQKLAQKLLEMNYEAVNERYDEKAGTPHIKYEPLHTNDVQTLKSMHCLQYQASEGDVPNTRTYKFLQGASDVLAEHIIEGLPEYERAEWGLSRGEKKVRA